MNRKIHHYESAAITVGYEPEICSHAAECLRALPAVFDNRRRRWIAPENGSVEEIVGAIGRCPSGALSYSLPADEAAADSQPKSVEARVSMVPNGPLILEGELSIRLPDGSLRRQPRAALCRCGASSTKPFCDGQHKAIGFEAE